MGNSEMKENYRGIKIFVMKNLFHANLRGREKGKKSKRIRTKDKIRNRKQYCPTIITGKHLLYNWSSCYL